MPFYLRSVSCLSMLIVLQNLLDASFRKVNAADTIKAHMSIACSNATGRSQAPFIVNVTDKGLQATYVVANTKFFMLGLVASSATATIDQPCQIVTSSGKIISSPGLCKKTGKKMMNHSSKDENNMWDKNNYDPNFVEKSSDGTWTVTLGGAKPFKYPDGAILWPDGRLTNSQGLTFKILIRQDGSRRGVQYYRQDRLTPLLPGEKININHGQILEQHVIED